jgi:thymidylate synthase (FAD)
MKIVRQGWSFEEPVDGEAILKKIELAGRTCYKSEDKITPESSRKFVSGVIKSGHMSVIEHHNVTVRIITDRGVTHEIVRHRIASYSQESTRYCNYSKDKFGREITVILPVEFYASEESEGYRIWKSSMVTTEADYFQFLATGASAQLARSVLPNSLKTEIIMTCNLREWRHFFTLRSSAAAHPQIRELATSMLQGFYNVIPVVFDDIQPNK